MVEPYAGRKRLTMNEIFFGLFLISSFAVATWACLRLSEAAFSTKSLLLQRSAVSENARINHFPKVSEGLNPLTLLTPLNLPTSPPLLDVTPLSDDAVTTTTMMTWQHLLHIPPFIAGTSTSSEVDYDWSTWGYTLRHGGPAWCSLVTWGAYLTMCRMRLLLASDIERNPGPNDVITTATMTPTTTSAPTASVPEINELQNMNFSMANSQVLTSLLRDDQEETDTALPLPQSVMALNDTLPSSGTFDTGAMTTSTQDVNNDNAGSPDLLTSPRLGSTFDSLSQDALLNLTRLGQSLQPSQAPQDSDLRLQQPLQPQQLPRADTQPALAQASAELTLTSPTGGSTFKSTFTTTLTGNTPPSQERTDELITVNDGSSLNPPGNDKTRDSHFQEHSGTETIVLKELGQFEHELQDSSMLDNPQRKAGRDMEYGAWGGEGGGGGGGGGRGGVSLLHQTLQ